MWCPCFRSQARFTDRVDSPNAENIFRLMDELDETFGKWSVTFGTFDVHFWGFGAPIYATRWESKSVLDEILKRRGAERHMHWNRDTGFQEFVRVKWIKE